MTPYLENMNIGDSIKMSGPRGGFYYYGNSHFKYKDKLTGK